MIAKYTRISTRFGEVMAASNLLRPDHRPEQIAEQKQSHDEPENVFPTHGDLGQILSQRRTYQTDAQNSRTVRARKIRSAIGQPPPGRTRIDPG
jgi:hypothetical protein